jgi:hypothetical protein
MGEYLVICSRPRAEDFLEISISRSWPLLSDKPINMIERVSWPRSRSWPIR